MRHLDLFSGIGGFSLAAEAVGYRTIAFVELDDFCRRVLAHHWPGVPIYGDIRSLSDATLDGLGAIDLLTGGFPCQPFSAAGKRLGQADDRYLWPAMRRVIAAVRPRWVCAENVDGLVRLGLDDCLSDLEVLGYTRGTVLLPACAVGAPHVRERCFIVAHTDGKRPAGQPQRQAGNGEAVGVGINANRLNGSSRLGHQPDRPATLPQNHPSDTGWWLATEPRPHQVGDGLPRGLVNRAFSALGNALVWRQVVPIIAAIATADQESPR